MRNSRTNLGLNRRAILLGGAALGLNSLAIYGAEGSEKLNFIVPAEEHPHQRTFMQWPVNPGIYEDRYFLEIVQKTIADIANTIVEFEPVTMLMADKYKPSASKLLSQKVEIWDIPTDDLWCRDSGPLFAIDPNGKIIVSHIQFNGWGNKQDHKNDKKIAVEVAKRLGLPIVQSGLKGEPGGVETNGKDLLIAHESSWVNENRNPGMSRSEITKRLLAAYGVDDIIWTPGVWGEDITDYHIDALARFTSADQILINLPVKPDMNDPFHVAALETYDALVEAELKVDVIPEPIYRRVKDIEFVASYANYYVCNGAVVAAQFGDKDTDSEALNTLKRHYPGREVVTLNVDPLGELGGGIHCATQQMPAV